MSVPPLPFSKTQAKTIESKTPRAGDVWELDSKDAVGAMNVLR